MDVLLKPHHFQSFPLLEFERQLAGLFLARRGRRKSGGRSAHSTETQSALEKRRLAVSRAFGVYGHGWTYGRPAKAEFVGAELKTYIDAHYDMDVSEAVDDIVLEFVLSEDGDCYPTEKSVQAAEGLNRRGLLSFPQMMETLRRGQVASFTAQFSIFYGIPVKTMYEALRQANGKALAHLCRTRDQQAGFYEPLPFDL